MSDVTSTRPALPYPFIQIAGICDSAEADLVIRCGVPALGFPLRLAVHPEDLTEDEATRVIASISPPSFGVLITYLDKAPDIDAFCRKLGVRHVQLHGDVTRDQLALLRKLDPDLFIIKSLIVRGGNRAGLQREVADLADFVDAFITDTYDPATGATGATGKLHDWRISADLVARSPRPVILAGGLKPDNVFDAIRQVRPAGVDAHTGVEGPGGRKNEALVRRFVTEAQRGFADLPR